MHSAYNKFNGKAVMEIKNQRIQIAVEGDQSQEKKKKRRNPTA